MWGIDAASTGTHGVLVVKAENGEVYAMDSSYNMGPFKEGIQKWKDTTMLDPSMVTDYWYISEVTPDSSELVRACQLNLQECAQQVSGSFSAPRMSCSVSVISR